MSCVTVTNDTNMTLTDAEIYNVTFVLETIALGAINLTVICGNVLVILAVTISRKLRTVTNHFIVSLAVADLMLGISVLPFSATLELLSYWIFGETWCVVWLAVDVLVCTASILNLCAISLDRYIAITRPMTYNSIMSPCRAKMLIAALWIVAFVISFPPLVGWNERDRNILAGNVDDYDDFDGFNYTYNDSYDVDMLQSLLNDIRTGASYKVTNISEAWFGTFSEELSGVSESYAVSPSPSNITLRGMNETCSEISLDNTYKELQCTLTSEPSYIVYSALGSFFIPTFIMLFLYWRIYREASEAYRSNKRGYKLTKGACSPGQDNALRSSMVLRIHRGNSTRTKAAANSCNHYHRQMRNGYSSRPGQYGRCQRKSRGNNVFYNNSHDCHHHHHNNHHHHHGLTCCDKSRRKSSTKITEHLKRLNNETRAAKTLAIIVGAFTFCWMPFFTVYLLGAFCNNCTPEIMFKIFFWLGYCNSAINPVIYAMFSKDFGHAFKQIIWCCCNRRRDRRGKMNFARRMTGRESVSLSSTENSVLFHRLSSHRMRPAGKERGLDMTI